MKILFTSIGALGHLFPMVPLARALRARGHDVCVATSPSLHPAIARAGLRPVSAGLEVSELVRHAQRRYPDAVAPDRRAARMFVEVAPAFMLSDLEALFRAGLPDLVIHEEGEYGGRLAAALHGIPSVTHGWPCPMRPIEALDAIASMLAPSWREHGLELGGARDLVGSALLDCCPPSLKAAAPPAFPTSSQLRPLLYDDAEGQPRPAWLERLGERPTIYVTLGTVPAFNENPGLFRRITSAVSAERANVVLTIGANNSLAELSALPDNVFVAQYLPQSLILARASLVVCHGGAGSTLGALTHGVPLLVLPQGAASQRRNAEACVAAGVGLSLDAESCTPENLRRQLGTLLESPGYRAAAQRVADEIARMPHPALVAEALSAPLSRPLAARANGLAPGQKGVTSSRT